MEKLFNVSFKMAEKSSTRKFNTNFGGGFFGGGVVVVVIL